LLVGKTKAECLNWCYGLLPLLSLCFWKLRQKQHFIFTRKEQNVTGFVVQGHTTRNIPHKIP